MYVQDESRVRLAQDAARFITGAAADRPAR
jgi:hypothetical protein